MREFVLFLLALFTLLGPFVFCLPRSLAVTNPTDDGSLLEAERLWEQAIAAKGGRERLYTIGNFVVSSKSRFRSSPRPDVAEWITEESLYVLPGKWWYFFDYRPGKMGYKINVLDFDRSIWWTVSPGKKVPIPSRTDLDKAVLDDFRYRFRQSQYLYLLETKWIKPTLVGARTDSIGFNKYDVVETVIAEREMRRLVQEGSTKRLKLAVIDNERDVRADFYFDRKTHLPVRIVTDSRAARGSGKGPTDDSCSLDDYAEVGGIQMPRIVNCGDKDNRTSYQFNVDYNKSIFERPPTADMKRDAWRVKRE